MFTGCAVDVLGALVAERAAHLVVAPAERILAYLRTAGTALCDCRGRKRDEIENVATIQRSFVGLAFVNDLAQRRISGLQQRGLRVHLHGLGAAPISRMASMRTVCCTCTSMDSRLKCLKPVLSTSTVYPPGFTLTKEYNPFWSVVNICFSPVAVLVSVTCAPGIAAPEASLTVPEIDPKVDCPWAVRHSRGTAPLRG